MWNFPNNMQISRLRCDQPIAFQKLIFQAVWSSVSGFKFLYHLFSSRRGSSCLRLLPRLPVPSIFHSIACLRRQAWPIQLVFLRFILCCTFLSLLTLCDTIHFSHDQSKWSYIPLQQHISKLFRYFYVISVRSSPSFSTIKIHAPNVVFR